MAVMASPALSPAGPPSAGSAAAAGEPGATAPTTGASKRTPTMKVSTKSAIAKIRLHVTPAVTTIMRFHTGARWKLRRSSETLAGSRSSWPSMRTYPPSGSARSDHSVSPIPLRASSSSVISMAGFPKRAMVAGSVDPARQPMPERHAPSTGPMPTAKLSQRMPAQRAAMKWPSSWIKMRTPNPRRMMRTFQPLVRISMVACGTDVPHEA